MTANISTVTTKGQVTIHFPAFRIRQGQQRARPVPLFHDPSSVRLSTNLTSQGG